MLLKLSEQPNTFPEWIFKQEFQSKTMLNRQVLTTTTTRANENAIGITSNRIFETLCICLITIALLSCCVSKAEARAPPEPYYGRYIGQFTNFAHGIKGSIYAVDESTLFIKSFAYDGTGPDAFFWVGKTPRPSPEGFIIPYPEEYTGIDPPILSAHNSTDIILRLPMGKRIKDIRWLSVWCRRFTVDFGEVFIPPGLDVPKPRVLPEFKRLAHGLSSSNISVLDAKTFYIPNLHYDGAGPDAYFWVGNGTKPHIMGIKVPNEIGSLEPLRGYQGEDIEIQLPGSLTVYDIDWLAVWCVEYQHNFGHVMIPKDLDVPPALGQTKITTTTTTPRPVYSNCKELLPDRLQVKWELQGEYLQIELFGRINEDQYMSFGLSGANGRAQMSQSDVVVAFYDTTTRVFRAEDYFISDLSQCDGQHGVCPDERIGGRNDVIVLSGDRKNGVTSIRYKRLIQTNEPIYDLAIPTDREVSIIAAIGPLNSRKEANAHGHTEGDHNPDDIRINFSSRNDHACKNSLYNVKDNTGPKPWPPIKIDNAKIFTARIGSAGGKRGYTAITNSSSWGIAWYLNDLLIPELTLQRGKSYEFYIEGGDNEANPAKYHPFYITDSPEGGLGQKGGQNLKQIAYAGVEYDEDGNAYPTALGRYCEWAPKSTDMSAKSETFEDYMKTLELKCVDGEPGYLNWTVPMDAPDLLYYQCFTHRNLGWKIHIIDAKDAASSMLPRLTSTQFLIYTITTLFSLVGMQTIFDFSITNIA